MKFTALVEGAEVTLPALPDETAYPQAATLAEDALTLAGMSLEHADDQPEVQRLRDRINDMPAAYTNVVSDVLTVVSQWLKEAAHDRTSDAEHALRNPDPWERVIGSAIMCEASTLNDLVAELALAAQLVKHPEEDHHNRFNTHTVERPHTPPPAGKGTLMKNGVRWYRRAWDAADADGSTEDVIAALNNPEEVIPDPAGHGRTRMTRGDVTAVVTPDGVILAWWRGTRP